jgi:hypothetical protein
MRWRSGVGTMGATIFLMAGSFAVGVPTAQAVTCSGGSCEGKNPQSSGCSSSASSVASAQTIYGRLEFELRYSSSCKTWWTRFVAINNGSVGTIDVERKLDSYPGTTTYLSKSGQEGWTAMLLNGSGYHFRACGTWEGQDTTCTNWYTKG